MEGSVPFSLINSSNLSDVQLLKSVTLCAAGAPVSVLCKGSLGPGACRLLAEERRWTGSHAPRRLPGPDCRSSAWRLCGGEALFLIWWFLKTLIHDLITLV